MSNYVKATNFAAKDSLVTTDPAKIIKGTDIDNEYNAIASAIASKADTNSPALTGTPTTPTATLGSNTTQIASTAFVSAAVTPVAAAIVPSGGIILWSGTIATIPTGWLLCNGSSGTPDLRNRFVIGAHSDTSSVAYTTVTGSNTKTGGTKDAIVVSHSHAISDPGHFHSIPSYATLGAGGSSVGVTSATQATGAAYTGITSTESTGDSGTNANLPPYFALAFIMKS